MAEDYSTLAQECIINGPEILAEKILSDQIFGGSVTIPTRDTSNGENPWVNKTIPFFMTNNFSFSLGNKWETLLPEAAGEFLSSLYNLSTVINNDKIEGAQMQIISKSMQSLTWKGSQKPEFSVDAVFVSTRRSYNPVQIINLLASTSLPIAQEQVSTSGGGMAKKLADGTDNVKNAAIKKSADIFGPDVAAQLHNILDPITSHLKHAGLFAPLEYKVKVDFSNDDLTDVGGTVALRIGQWFFATELVVKDISNIEFSKETVAPPPEWLTDISAHQIYGKNALVQNLGDSSKDWGFPVYAKCNLTLVPIKPITYKEFSNYFVVPQLPQDPPKLKPVPLLEYN